MRELQLGGANQVAALGGAAVDLQSGAWFEAATIRMGVDSEHGSAVLAVLELLLGPEGLPGRFHVANRNDTGSACAGMLAEVLRTADAELRTCVIHCTYGQQRCKHHALWWR
jgi:hypothetical protein